MPLHVPVITTPFTCADVLACLEREFSDWSIYDSFADPDHTGNKYEDAAILNSAETEIIISNNVGTNTGILKVYDIASKVLGAGLISDVTTRDRADAPTMSSALGTYLAVIWATTVPANVNRMSIVKDGVVIKTFTDAELGFFANTIVGVFVSASGKYIIVGGYLPAPIDSWGWVVLEGS